MTGGWAATNTLRDAPDSPFGPGDSDRYYAALALVEAALDAAEGVMTQMDYETPHHTRLREALDALNKEPA